jgi:peptidoglycan/xylan/chitin deacetylase (PgdA/CDA1 family)
MDSADRLPVLTYHAIDTRASVISVPPEEFRRQMEMLAQRGRTGISLEDAFAHRERDGRFPPGAVVLTFDDGYLSVLSEALPAMQELGFRGTVFVISGLVGLNAAAARERNRYIDRDLLGWNHLAELAAAGFEIGSHTVRHPDLRRLDAPDLDRELRDSRAELEQRLQRPVESFAYPFGYVNVAVAAAAAVHYRRACTTRLGVNPPRPDPLRLRRVDAYYLRRPGRFRSFARGGLGAWLGFRHALREFKSPFQRGPA